MDTLLWILKIQANNYEIFPYQPYLLSICTGILWKFDFHQFEISSFIFFLVWTGKKSQLAKSKIPVRVVKNVISKWTKMEFPRFPFLWFTEVGVVNSPEQKLVMYISVNCKKGINSWARSIKIFYPSSETWKKIQFELVKITSLFSN